MRRAAVVLGVISALLPLTARTAWAQCECDPSLSTPQGQAGAASVVFTGTVTSITTPGVDDVAVQFGIETLYKGKAGHSITVTTPLKGGSCHFDFRPRRRYTVFADSELVTTSCSGNVQGVINAGGYGFGVSPTASGATPTTAKGIPAWVWVGIALMLVAAGGTNYVLARRRVRGRSPN